MDPAPLTPDLGTLGWIIVDAALMLGVVILVVRLAGLRSFAKMSSFDFAVTVATGSILASIVVDPDKSFVHGLVVIAALLGTQVVVALVRLRSRTLQGIIDNEPLLLMEDGAMIEANLRAGRVTRQDLLAKLREANVLDPQAVRAVVLETTGDISVLHAGDPTASLSAELLEGVRRTS